MEEALQDVAQQDTRSERDTHCLNRLHDRADDVWRRLEAVRPYQVHEMQHRVFAVQACNTERQVLHDDTRRLPMDEVAVREGVLEHCYDGVDIVRRLRSDVLKDEGQSLQTARSDVEFSGAVLVQNSWDTSES